MGGRGGNWCHTFHSEVQTMLERFDVPTMCATIQVVLPRYAPGRVTGVEEDTVDSVPSTVPSTKDMHCYAPFFVWIWMVATSSSIS